MNSEAFSWTIAQVTNGIAYREAGRSRDVVLVHGLGMSSAYFDRFARALLDRGFSPVAPDLPGFGESRNAPAGGADEHAEILMTWADTLAIRNAVWIGHSLGCNAVVHLAAARPDLVRKVVCIGPLWSRETPLRLLPALVVDAFRESFSLFAHVIRAYWRSGLWRWFATFRRYAADLHSTPPRDALMIAGEDDPLPDRRWIPNLTFVPGAHACHFAFPGETASLATQEEGLDGVAGNQNDQRDSERDQSNAPLTGAAGNS